MLTSQQQNTLGLALTLGLVMLLITLPMAHASTHEALPRTTQSHDSTPPNAARTLNIGHTCHLIDPRYANHRDCLSLIGNIYEPLVRLDDKGQPAPGLAKRWVLDSNQKTIRFELDPTRRWSDGKAITVEDIISSWASSIKEQIKGHVGIGGLMKIKGAQALKDGQSDALSGLEVVDPYTLVVHFTHFDTSFPMKLSYASFSPIPSHAYRLWGDDWATQKNPPASGLYQPTLLGHKNVSLSVNPQHPNHDTLSIRHAHARYYQASQFPPQPSQLREVMTQADSPHFFFISNYDIEQLQGYLAKHPWRAQPTNHSAMRGLLINMVDLPQTQAQTIKCAITSSEYVSRYTKAGFLSASRWANLNSISLPAIDLSHQEHGCQRHLATQATRQQAPTNIELITYLAEGEDPRHHAVLQAILKPHKMTLRTTLLPVSEFGQRMARGEYQISLFNWNSLIPDPSFYFLLIDMMAHWLNPEHKAKALVLLNDANQRLGKERLALIAQVEQLILEKGGLVPLAQIKRSYIAHQDLCGLDANLHHIDYRRLYWCNEQ